MAEDDIYGSKGKYERFKASLDDLTLPLDERNYRRRYRCKNRDNLRYFRQLFAHFEARDLSYIRRVRLLQSLRLVCHLTVKDLADCTRDDINAIVAAMHGIYATPKSKQTFICDLKYFWKTLLPDRDAQGRPDETIIPYMVRHISSKIDRSRQKLRQDKLTSHELEQLMDYFAGEPRLQAYLAVSVESLARPQELLLRRIRDVEQHDNYARLYLTEHGKEGPGLLQCIDSYPYLVKWLNVHPRKHDPDAFLFVNTGNTERFGPLRPENVNKFLRCACASLDIRKPVTCYSLKRNGVTIRRLRGESDMEIQHAARWTSTKQLKTYDMSSQEEAFTKELEKRGLVPTTEREALATRRCAFCDRPAGFAEVMCQQCKRPLDRSAIREEVRAKDSKIEELTHTVEQLSGRLSGLKQQLLQELAAEVLSTKRRTRRGVNSALGQPAPRRASASLS